MSFLVSFNTNDPSIQQACGQIGQFSNTICSTLLFVFTSEIYPTVIRSMGFGTLNALGRLGSMMAPLLFYLIGSEYSCLVFGLMSAVAGMVVWLLPETKGETLIDDLEDGEMFNRNLGG